jgi:hypothetical protein
MEHEIRPENSRGMLPAESEHICRSVRVPIEADGSLNATTIEKLLLSALTPVYGDSDESADALARALEEVPPDLRPRSRSCCFCKFSDAWRCAREKNLPTIACQCECHRYTFRKEPWP